MQLPKNTKLLKIEFPEALPVSGQRDKITQALEKHQVVIVCGETGSGKTTQLPKICLAMGRGRANGTGKLIGHTQPRRIAATSTAKRIAQELGSPLGEDVGYQVRFADKTSTSASVKLMTDGILLAERIRLEIENQVITHPDGFDMPGITVSIGLALSDASSTSDSLFAAADRQLYLAKQSGRNCIRY